MDTKLDEPVILSEAAVNLLRRRLAKELVEVTEENRPLFSELVEAGLMMPLSTWAGGPESRFLFTEMGWNRREEFLTASAPPP